MKIRQSFTLLRQNPFFSVVSIIGTAVSIAPVNETLGDLAVSKIRQKVRG